MSETEAEYTLEFPWLLPCLRRQLRQGTSLTLRPCPDAVNSRVSGAEFFNLHPLIFLWTCIGVLRISVIPEFQYSIDKMKQDFSELKGLWFSLVFHLRIAFPSKTSDQMEVPRAKTRKLPARGGKGIALDDLNGAVPLVPSVLWGFSGG